MFRLRALWFIFPLIGVSYAISIAVRGLWIGPYLAGVFGADTATIGRATLIMGLAMIAGTLAYGPLDKALRSRKWMIAGGSFAALIAAVVLIIIPSQSAGLSIAMMCAIGFFGATYPVIMAHGRSFLPPHLIGRGVTMLNLFSIGGVGLLQFLSGNVFSSAVPAATTSDPFVAVFTLFAMSLAVGLVIYLFSSDSPN